MVLRVAEDGDSILSGWGPDTFLTVGAPSVKRAFSGRTQHDTTATTPPSADTLQADENTRVSCN